MIPTGSARRPTLAILAAFALALPVAVRTQDAQVLEPGAARAAAHGPAAEALLAHLAALARDGDGAALAGLAARALSDATLAPAARERVLYESALALAQLEPSPSAQSLLDTLAAREPELRVWRDDDAHRIAVPLYDVAAAARYALRRADERGIRDAALAAIARAGDEPLALYDAQAYLTTPAARGVMQAFESAPAEQLRPYRDGLRLDAARGTRVEVAEIVARRLGDAALMEAVLAQASPASALAIVRGARAAFVPADAFDLLAAAARRDDVGSAALLEVGHLAAADARARTLLFDALADPRRAGSAAAALASSHDAQIAAELRDWVLAQSDATLARRGILALRLDAGESARTELSRLAVDPRLSAELRSEAQR